MMFYCVSCRAILVSFLCWISQQRIAPVGTLVPVRCRKSWRYIPREHIPHRPVIQFSRFCVS